MKRILALFQAWRKRILNRPTASPVGEREMLVLSRRLNEAIVINSNIRISVVEIRGDNVRLGVELPREIPVHREESITAATSRTPVPLVPPIQIAPLQTALNVPLVEDAVVFG